MTSPAAHEGCRLMFGQVGPAVPGNFRNLNLVAGNVGGWR
jgi:hypothetical protein